MSTLARDSLFDALPRVTPIRSPLIEGPRVWLFVVAAALLAPLITWLPMLAIKYPGLGLHRLEPSRGIDVWHMQVLWGLAFAVVAWIVGRGDRWLGAAVGWLGLGVLLWGSMFDVTHRIAFLAGALILWAIRQTPKEWRPMVLTLLAASGVFQAAYIVQQLAGFDLLWGPLLGFQTISEWRWVGDRYFVSPEVSVPYRGFVQCMREITAVCVYHPLRPVGTLGTVDAATAYVAMLAPLMPWWLLLLPVTAVFSGHSIGAILALVAGLLIRLGLGLRARGRRVALGVPLALAMALGWYWYAYHMPPHIPSTVQGRVDVWSLAVKDWLSTAPLAGHGSWANRIPGLQLARMKDAASFERLKQTRLFAPTGEVFMEAHNEYLQWGYEAGLIGLALAAGWAWRHRRMFWTSALAPCLWAMAINAGSFFTFHVVSVALAGLILVGLATSDHAQEVSA